MVQFWVSFLGLLGGVCGAFRKPNVLIVYADDAFDQTKQVAEQVANGSQSAGANTRILKVEMANYKHDVYEWADAVVLGSGVYNGNAAPSLLAFVNSFDFHDRLLNMVGGSFATGGSAVSGLEPVLQQLSRSLRTFGMVTVGGTSWRNAHGTGAVTSYNKPISNDCPCFEQARDQGRRTAQLAATLMESAPPSPGPSPQPVSDGPAPWGENFTAQIAANFTQVGYDAGIVIVNFTSHCSTPSTQKMRTVYGDFDTVITRCDLGREFIINPPSRGGKCMPRVIGRDVDKRICEACGCPFCVRDTQGTFTHGEDYPSQTVWNSKERTEIFGHDVYVWKGVAVSSVKEGQSYALSTSIAYLAADPSIPVYVNVTHPLWTQTQATVDHFTHEIDEHDFDIPDACFRQPSQEQVTYIAL